MLTSQVTTLPAVPQCWPQFNIYIYFKDLIGRTRKNSSITFLLPKCQHQLGLCQVKARSQQLYLISYVGDRNPLVGPSLLPLEVWSGRLQPGTLRCGLPNGQLNLLPQCPNLYLLILSDIHQDALDCITPYLLLKVIYYPLVNLQVETAVVTIDGMYDNQVIILFSFFVFF